MSTHSQWAPARAAADYLQVSERTLHRWRAAEMLKPGEHYRRKFPAVNSPLLYHLERCEQAMTAAFARDHRTLELAGG
jgi:predicted site-specific integrase-resolvase